MDIRNKLTSLALILILSIGIYGQTTSPAAQFVIGPQAPIGSSWFDTTQVARARVHGQACPVNPPPPPLRSNFATEAEYQAAFQAWADGPLNTFNLHNYYDTALNEYVIHQRTGNGEFLAYARKCADAWWQHPQWIKSGAQRDFDNGQGPPPRHAGIGGLILRALDGRPEMWDWITAYTRHQFNLWLKQRINNPELYYGVREGAFMLHFATWVAAAHPDATVRAELLADAENVAVNYFARLQQSDGSWRWNTAPDEFLDTVQISLISDAPIGATLLRVNPIPYAIAAGQKVQFVNGGTTKTTRVEAAGAVSVSVEPLPAARQAGNAAFVDDGTLQGITQPFMVGLLLNALVDLHRLSTNATVKANVMTQITKSLRHLYLSGPYRTTEIPGIAGKKWRDPWYYYHGGTSVNPTKYQNGGGSYTDALARNDDCGTNPPCTVGIGRQAISTIFAAYGYAYVITGDPFFKTAGDELFDSAFVGTDGFRGLADSSAKNFNQNYYFGARYLAWRNQEPTTPTPSPSPTPVPSPSATPTPSPTPVPSPTPPSVVEYEVQYPTANSDADRKRVIESMAAQGWICQPNPSGKFVICHRVKQ